MIRGHKTYKDIMKEAQWKLRRSSNKEPEKIRPSYTWYYTIWKQQNLKQYETERDE